MVNLIDQATQRTPQAAPMNTGAIDTYWPSTSTLNDRLAHVPDVTPYRDADRMTHRPFELAIPDGMIGDVARGAGETVLSLLPGSGEAMSAQDYFHAMDAASHAEGWAKAPHYAAAATAALGMVPLAGALARGARKVGAAVDSLIDATSRNADTPQRLLDAGRGSHSVTLLEARPPVTSNMRRIEDAPVRPIEADYPKGVPADDTGPLRESIDGTPLTAPFIAGRRSATGLDQALQPEDVVAVGEGLTGRPPEAVPSRALPRGASGVYRSSAGVDGPERYIQYHQRLEGSHLDNVIAHEVGHAIDHMAGGRGGIPVTGAVKQFDSLYHVQSGARASLTDPPRQRTRPEHLGYRGDHVRAEKMAEAVRLYMQNPAFMKEHFPKAARRIREHVNTDPEVSRIVQFNQVGVPLGASALALSGRTSRGKSKKTARKQRQ